MIPDCLTKIDRDALAPQTERKLHEHYCSSNEGSEIFQDIQKQS
ncbi:MAG: hypothetical protein AAGD25_41005 [Cyanobacteria bacterium P01_F01_bin.150]